MFLKEAYGDACQEDIDGISTHFQRILSILLCALNYHLIYFKVIYSLNI